MSADDSELHYSVVAKALEEGRVVPLLGAGVNLCGRQVDEAWVAGSQHLPSGSELADHLGRESQVSSHMKRHEAQDLARVAQTVATVWGRAYLYEKLHAILDADYEPTSLHRLLARLPGALRERGSPHPYQLILTTNYDDTLERAFREVSEPFDVVWYAADGPRGRFWHLEPAAGAEPHLIERPNEYDRISLDERTVILKFHGAVDRVDPDRDSYVITEDHYIDYLTRTHVTSLLPPELMAKLNRSHFLFLAYALRDWNVRVILHRIWERQRLDYTSWAVQLGADPVDSRMWETRNVDIRSIDLGEYVRELAGRLRIPL